MCPGHQGLEYGMETIGTSASGPQPTAAHLSSPTLTHRDQGSAPFPASLTPPFPPQCLLPPQPTTGGITTPLQGQLRPWSPC